MDFGLARLTEASRLTKADTTMGTVAYMSPEQAQGIAVDHRSDIWALGCVIYEMVCGQRPFRGQYDQALFYEIVHQEPEPLTGVRAGVPMELEFIVGKCLAKAIEDRYGHADEISKDLRSLGEKLKSGRSTILRTTNLAAGVPATLTAGQTVNPVEALPPGAVLVPQNRLRSLQALAGLLAVALLALSALYFAGSPREPSEKRVRRFSLAPQGLQDASISPDGRYILYAAQTAGESTLWLRSLSDESARELPGTAGAFRGFWAPDSSSIGFAVGRSDGQLKRVSINGGDPVTLCELPTRRPGLAFIGGTWSPGGERIVFSSNLRLYEVAAWGGQPKLLFDPGGPWAFYPHFLPTGAGPPALVYSTSSSSTSRIVVLNLETMEPREVGPGDRPAYSRDGYLIHGLTEDAGSGDRGLWALPFSLATLRPAGEDLPISTAGSGAAVSQDGTLVYLEGTGSNIGQTLVWRDRSGKMLQAIGQPQPNMDTPALSPDGRRVAVYSTESGNADIWVHDLIRSTKMRLTFDESLERTPAWSPSGGEIVYWLQSGGGDARLMKKAADGTGEAVVLVEAKHTLPDPDWSRDGRYLVYQERNSRTSWDISYLRFEPSGDVAEPATFLKTAATEVAPKLSPDARFLAYISDESGRFEIYIRSFPDGAGKWQASVNGGMQPRWRSDGRELYYVEASTLMAVAVSTGQGLTLGLPQKLFESTDLRSAKAPPSYDVSANGQKFVTIAPVEGGKTEPPKIHIVENWYEEFRDRKQD
jgi:eukaryotic-like serine/threonine-protein kinase